MNRRTITLFTAINLLNYLDRYLVPALLPLIQIELALNNQRAGWLVSAFVFGYFMFSPLFGWLGDRYRRPLLMAFGVVLWSVATGLTGLAQGFVFFLGVRVLTGVGEASFGSVAPGFLKDSISDPIRLNRTFSIFFSAIPVGSALGYVLGGVVSQYASWRLAFLLGGIPGILLSIFLIRLKDPREGRRGGDNIFRGIARIAAVPILWFAIIGYILNSFALCGIATFVTGYGVAIGFDPAKISQYFGMILVVTGALGTLGGGFISNALIKRGGDQVAIMLRFISIASFVAFPFAFLAFSSSTHLYFLIFCFLAELFVFLTVAPINSILVLSCPSDLVTLTQGLTIFALNMFGAFLAPILLGAVADAYSLAISLQCCTAALLFSGLVWYLGIAKATVRNKVEG